MRLIAGDLTATSGTLSIDGRVGVMRQLVGVADASEGAPTTVRELLVSLAPPAVRAAATAAGRSPSSSAEADPMRYADGARRLGRPRRLRRRGALGRVRHPGRRPRPDRPSPTGRCARSPAASRSASRSRSCCAATTTSCCSTSRTTSSTCPAKRWLERELAATRKTVLYVSHDRELLAATATKIVTVEAEGAWTHGGGFAGYAEARQGHLDKLQPRPVAGTTTSASGCRPSSPR